VMRPPFLWPCNQRSLPWFGDQMWQCHTAKYSMNIMGRLVMRPPILLVRSCIYLFHFFLGSLSFLSRGFLLPSRGSPGRSISRFYFPMAFIFYQLLLPPRPLAPSSHKTRCTLEGHPNGQTRGMGWMSRI
jgi:hypothetical protein